MMIVDKDAGLRLADAATLLLDAAREVAKQGPDYKPGEANETAVLALATQAVFFADFDLHDYGEMTSVDPKRATARMRGMALGLGAMMGATPDPLRAIAHYLDCSQTMRTGMAQRLQFNEAEAAARKAPK